MKLELKHLAPYYPFELKIFIEGDGFLQNDEVFDLNAITHNGVNVSTKSFPYNTDYCFDEIKPILRPLSDLDSYIDGTEFTYFDEMLNLFGDFELQHTNECYYPNTNEWISFIDTANFINKLYEWHFDVFGLIPAGLAIDKNKLNK